MNPNRIQGKPLGVRETHQAAFLFMVIAGYPEFTSGRGADFYLARADK